MAENDISKIVNLIMQNPELIEQIKKLGDKDGGEEDKTDAQAVETPPDKEAEKEEVETSAAIKAGERSKRRELLCALKPYVSEERSRAIDSMMSIADILDVMRSK